MPITSSGQIALIADIEAEFDQTGTTDISLFQARDDAGLDAGQVAMTQFYSHSDVALPSVGNAGVSSISASSMVISGNVTNDGGGTVTQTGFYFGTSSTVTNNTKYTVGSGTGSFNRTMSGLSSSTTYYYSAYAINAAGETVAGTSSASTSQANVSSVISFSGCSTSSNSSYNSIICGTNGFSVTNNSGATVTMDAYASQSFNHTFSLQYHVYARYLSGYGDNRKLLDHGSASSDASLSNGFSDSFGVQVIYNPPAFASSGSVVLYLTFARSGYATYYYQIFTGSKNYSDVRLKTNINLVGRSPLGLNIYTWNYIDAKYGVGTFKGVMAQEVPDYARSKDEKGFFMVDYNVIDVDFEKIKNE